MRSTFQIRADVVFVGAALRGCPSPGMGGHGVPPYNKCRRL